MCSHFDEQATTNLDQLLGEAIRIEGFAMVEISGGSAMIENWAYSIGLTERHDHSELVTVGFDFDVAVAVTSLIAGQIADGARFGPNAAFETPEGPVTFAPVHRRHVERAMFDTWFGYYGDRAADGSMPPFAALQIVPPSHWFDHCNRHAHPRLDTAEIPPPPRPNRSTRRASLRGRHW